MICSQRQETILLLLLCVFRGQHAGSKNCWRRFGRISAATRLMEQGFDITLYEQNDFLGGEPGAHRDDEKDDPHEQLPHVPELVQ